MFNRRTFSLFATVAIATMLLFTTYLLAHAQVSATTTTVLTVNSSEDSDDGTCNAAHCTLREAINEANVSAEPHTIAFSLPSGITITLNGTQLPTITEKLTISGTEALSLTISGNHASRVFEIGSGAAVTMTQLTIANGAADYGGGIYNAGTLVLLQSALRGNSAWIGGGIYNYDGGTLTVANSTFSDNSARVGSGVIEVMLGTATISNSMFIGNSAHQGGVIGSDGSTLTVTNSTFRRNSAINRGGVIDIHDVTLTISNSTFISNNVEGIGSLYLRESTVTVRSSTFYSNSSDSGGGLYNRTGEVTIENSAFSGNSAAYGGGGVFNNHGGTLTLTNSTVRGNSAALRGAGGGGGGLLNRNGTMLVRDSTVSDNVVTDGSGGGIFNDNFYGEVPILEVVNSTISGNSAVAGGGIANFEGMMTVRNSTLSGNSATVSGYAGGIDNYHGTMTVQNSIVANSPNGEDCVNDGGTIVAFANNLVESGDCGSAITADPLLSPLQDNGGATFTHALLPGSPAIDAGDGSECEATDQRDITRPQGSGCDIGAFELQGFSLTILGGDDQTTAVGTAFTEPLGVQVTSDSGEPVGPGGVVTFSAPTAGASITGTNPFTVATTASGTVSQTVTANDIAGTYNVTVETAGGDAPVTFTLTNTNTLPVADAGEDQQVLVGDTVRLDGSGSHEPDGHVPLNYGWQQTGGPVVALSDSTVVSPTFTAPETPTVLTFTLTVTDTYGLSSMDEVVIEVWRGLTPVADAGMDQQMFTGDTVRLDGSGSYDPDGHEPLSYEWQQTGGPAVVLSDHTVISPTFAAPEATGLLTFTLTVTDTFDLSSMDEVVVQVAHNLAPVVDAGDDQQMQPGAVVILNGTDSYDPDGHEPLSYGWRQTGGPAVMLSDSTVVSPTFTAPETPTVLTFTLTVTDSYGLSSMDEVIVEVQQNLHPVADAGLDQQVFVGDVVVLDGSSSYDPDGYEPMTYTWQQTGGPAVVLSDHGAISSTFTAPATTGLLTFLLTVTDRQGLSSTDEVVIEVVEERHAIYLPFLEVRGVPASASEDPAR